MLILNKSLKIGFRIFLFYEQIRLTTGFSIWYKEMVITQTSFFKVNISLTVTHLRRMPLNLRGIFSPILYIVHCAAILFLHKSHCHHCYQECLHVSRLWLGSPVNLWWSSLEPHRCDHLSVSDDHLQYHTEEMPVLYYVKLQWGRALLGGSDWQDPRLTTVSL